MKLCLIINWEISAQRLVIREWTDQDVETELQMCRWTHCAGDGREQLNAPASSLHLPSTSHCHCANIAGYEIAQLKQSQLLFPPITQTLK